MIKGPHALYTGSNGHVTAGITVRSDLTREECKKEGLRFEWDVNLSSLRGLPASHFHLSENDMAFVLIQCANVEEPEHSPECDCGDCY